MLNLAIVQYLMRQEGREFLVSGRLQGYSISHLQKQHGIAKGTFYRAVNELIKCNIIVKQKRNSYVLSAWFRMDCNAVLQAERVSV